MRLGVLIRSLPSTPPCVRKCKPLFVQIWNWTKGHSDSRSQALRRLKLKVKSHNELNKIILRNLFSQMLSFHKLMQTINFFRSHDIRDFKKITLDQFRKSTQYKNNFQDAILRLHYTLFPDSQHIPISVVDGAQELLPKRCGNARSTPQCGFAYFSANKTQSEFYSLLILILHLAINIALRLRAVYLTSGTVYHLLRHLNQWLAPLLTLQSGEEHLKHHLVLHHPIRKKSLDFVTMVLQQRPITCFHSVWK